MGILSTHRPWAMQSSLNAVFEHNRLRESALPTHSLDKVAYIESRKSLLESPGRMTVSCDRCFKNVKGGGRTARFWNDLQSPKIKCSLFNTHKTRATSVKPRDPLPGVFWVSYAPQPWSSQHHSPTHQHKPKSANWSSASRHCGWHPARLPGTPASADQQLSHLLSGTFSFPTRRHVPALL